MNPLLEEEPRSVKVNRWGVNTRFEAIWRTAAVPRPTRQKSRRRGAILALSLALVGYLGLQGSLQLLIQREILPVADPMYTEKLESLRRWPDWWTTRAPGAPRRMLFLGSSRTQLAVDAQRISHQDPDWQAFNFGSPGAGPHTLRLYSERLLQSGLQVDCVWLEVHPALWCGEGLPFESRWLQPYRLRAGEPELLQATGWPLETPTHLKPHGWLSTSAAFRLGLLNRYWPTMLPSRHGLTIGSKQDDWGYVSGIDLSSTEAAKALQRAHVDYAAAFPGRGINPSAQLAIRDIVRAWRAHGCQIGWLVLPEQAEFQAWYGPDHAQRWPIELARFATELDVPLWDGRDWVDPAGMVDGHHLNRQGALQFTQKFLAYWHPESQP